MTFVKYLDMQREKTMNKTIIKEIKEGRWMESVYKYFKKNIFGDYNSFENFLATKLRVWWIGWSYTYYYWCASLKVN